MISVSFIILSVLIILQTIISIRDKKKYEVLKSLTSTIERQKMFKKGLMESFLFYGFSAILGLLILDKLPLLNEFPPSLSEYSRYLNSFSFNSSEGLTVVGILKLFLIYLIPFLLIGTSLLNLILVFLHHRKNPEEDQSKGSMEINHLLPWNKKERFWVSMISINAGFSEEIFFRLFLPVLFYGIIESSSLAIILPAIWFGLSHNYQGLNGIIGTFIAGLMLFYVYLLSQSIWVTIALHIFLDLNGLVFTPLFRKFLEKRKKSALLGMKN